MTKLFVTGATGYIGGDALHTIVRAHPDYEVTALVRNSDKGAVVAKEYASVKLVFGNLDSVELLEEEAKRADVVCRESHLSFLDSWVLVPTTSLPVLRHNNNAHPTVNLRSILANNGDKC